MIFLDTKVFKGYIINKLSLVGIPIFLGRKVEKLRN